jgi:hypothetical protein
MNTWFAKLFRDDRSVSFGRFMSVVLTAFVLGWNTAHLVFAWRFNYHLAPGQAPFPLLPDASTLIAQGGFVTLFYGISKAGGCYVETKNANAGTEKIVP